MAALVARLTGDVSRRTMIWLAALLAALVIAPWVVNDYLVTVLILILYLAYTGQAWNIMMGFAGQLSLGHAIYAGLGAYIAAALFTRYGIGPWFGFLAAMPVAAACGAVIGFLAFRFGVTGVYFAILTIAFAEFARIGFDHLDIVNAAAGLFLPVAQYAHNDLWRLRGDPTMFYYVILAATLAAFVLCRAVVDEPYRLFLARHPRGRGSRARRRHRYLSLQNVCGDDLGRRDFVRRRVLRVFLQQSFPRTGVQYLAVDPDDSGSHHRRRRHAVRPDPRRVRAHRPCGIAELRFDGVRLRSAGRASKCSTAYASSSSSWRCRRGFGRGWRGGSALRSVQR